MYANDKYRIFSSNEGGKGDDYIQNEGKNESKCVLIHDEAVMSQVSLQKKVPFFYYPPSYSQVLYKSDPKFTDLASCVNSYRNEASKIIASLQDEYEITRVSESIIMYNNDKKEDFENLQSQTILQKIIKHAKYFESDGFVLENLLQPFDIVRALSYHLNEYQIMKPKSFDNVHDNDVKEIVEIIYNNRNTSIDQSIDVHENEEKISGKNSFENRWIHNNTKENSLEATTTYSTAAQIIAHLTRDWTDAGKSIRESIYTWCVDKVLESFSSIERLNNEQDNSKTNINVMDEQIAKQMNVTKQEIDFSAIDILVPGAALGRLAHEIAVRGFNVEANDCSLEMAAVANRLLQGKAYGRFHPYIMDYFVNEINNDRRYEELIFPDCEYISWLLSYNQKQTSSNSDRGDLSYTIGDFVEVYTAPERNHTFHGIVTCFFIDTATNLFQYLKTIQHLLRPNGIWINVGPVQWHQNAQIRPSVDELYVIIKEKMKWDVLLWEIDDVPLQYRSDTDGGIQFTKMSAYFPLRFIVRKKSQ